MMGRGPSLVAMMGPGAYEMSRLDSSSSSSSSSVLAEQVDEGADDDAQDGPDDGDAADGALEEAQDLRVAGLGGHVSCGLARGHAVVLHLRPQ